MKRAHLSGKKRTGLPDDRNMGARHCLTNISPRVVMRHLSRRTVGL